MFVTPKTECAVVISAQVEQRFDLEPQTQTQTCPRAAGLRCSSQDTYGASKRTPGHFAFQKECVRLDNVKLSKVKKRARPRVIFKIKY